MAPNKKYPVRPLAMLAFLVVAFAATEFLPTSGSHPGFGTAAAEDQGSICNVTSTGLRSCRSSMNQPKPAPACCTALSHANLTCLCGYKSYLPMLGIDPTQAMQLPSKCNIPPPDNC